MTIRRSFRLTLALVCGFSLLVLSAIPSTAQMSPVGAWDVVLGGYQRGVAQITFFEDGTLEGAVVLSFKGSSVTRTNGGLARTNLYGAATIRGNWLYDRTNRISGYLNLIGSGAGGATMVTNGVSFRGAVKSTRINLDAFGPSGRFHLRGIPWTTDGVVDLGGASAYLGSARIRGQRFPVLEVFHMTTESPNTYGVEGGGPGYNYVGTILISNQRVAAFFQNRGTGGEGTRVAAYAGPFNVNRRRGTLIGTDGVNHGIRFKIAQGTIQNE